MLHIIYESSRNKEDKKKMKLLCLLTSKLQNASRFNREFVIISKNSLCLSFLRLLCKEGFIARVVEINSGKLLKIYLKYEFNGLPVLKNVKHLSKPGKPIYFTYTHLTKFNQGVGVIVLSTTEGLLTGQSCLKSKIGGTALCYLI